MFHTVVRPVCTVQERLDMEEGGILIIPATTTDSDHIFRPNVIRREEVQNQADAITTPIIAGAKGGVITTATYEENNELTNAAIKDEENGELTSTSENDEVVRRNLFGEDSTEIEAPSSGVVDAKVAPQSTRSIRRGNAVNDDVSGISRTKRVRFDETASGRKDKAAVAGQMPDRQFTYAAGPVYFDLTFEETSTQLPPPSLKYSCAASYFTDDEEEE